MDVGRANRRAYGGDFDSGWILSIDDFSQRNRAERPNNADLRWNRGSGRVCNNTWNRAAPCAGSVNRRLRIR